MAAIRKTPESSKPRRPPATTPQARENQMISHAVTLAEKQMVEGTASSAVITHYLKLATSREKLEQEKLTRENEVLRVKAEAMQSGKQVEALYKNALDAMRAYSGQEVERDEDED